MPAAAVVALGLLATALLGDLAVDRAERSLDRRFDQVNDDVKAAIAQDLGSYLRGLSQIATFAGTHDPPAPADFEWFARSSGVMTAGNREAVLYVERIEGAEIAAFVAREQAAGRRDAVPLSLHYGTQGPMAVITRVAAETGSVDLPLFDLTVLPTVARGLDAAAASQSPVAIDLDAAYAEIVDPEGELVRRGLPAGELVQPVLDYFSPNGAGPGDFGYAVVVPVPGGPGSPDTVGWVVSSLDPPDLLTGYGDRIRIVVRLGADGPVVASGGPAVMLDNHRRDVNSIDAGGIEWTVEVWATDRFVAVGEAWSTVRVVRLAGIAVSLLLGILLAVRVFLRRRTREIQDRLDVTSHQARHDPLTGLLNRAAMHALLEERAGARAAGPYAVLFIDLDRMKIVNDSLGHSVGDELLKAAAARLQRVVGDRGTTSRFGGDEFVVALFDVIDAASAMSVALELIAALDAPIATSALDLTVNASIGIRLVPAGSRHDAETLVRDADTAMYEAKTIAGSAAVLFDERLREQVTDRLDLEQALRAAIVHGEITVHFQPLVDTDRDRIASFEALVRWDRGELGTVGPNRFLPIANETGLIVLIGDIVIDQACAFAAALRALEPENPIGVAINLSERELLAPRVVERVGEALLRHGVPASLLTVEINEDVMISDRSHALDVLRMLAHLGVQLAIDDFGTGLASLAHVKRLDMVSVIKIDKTFVEDIGTDGADRAIVSAVVTMSERLGLQVVAEGVELEEQECTLRSLGVNVMQGFRWSPALPAERAVELARMSARRGLAVPSARPVAAASLGA